MAGAIDPASHATRVDIQQKADLLRSRVLWSTLLATMLVLLGAAGTHLRNHPGVLEATFHMAVDTAGSGQLFIRGRDGYSEANSYKFALAHGQGTQAHVVGLRLVDHSRNIRLDPGTGMGSVRIESIAFTWRGHKFELDGPSLHDMVRPMKHIDPVPAKSGASFRSTGGDPHLEIDLPELLVRAIDKQAKVGFALILASVTGLALLMWANRHGIAECWRRGINHDGRCIFVVTAVAALILLDLLDTGCDGICSPRGLGFGSLLLLASLLIAGVGQVVLRLLSVEQPHSRPRVFLSLLSGQAVLVLYIAMRSVIHAWIPAMPVTGAELVLLALAAWGWLLLGTWGVRHSTTSVTPSRAWPWMELALLAVVCIVIGERELPRLVMLSSDPDTHAYFARRLELVGGIPWFGPDAFHYPMGTAALGYVWAKLGFLDVRNAVTALPLLQAFFAALVLAEGLATRMRDPRARLILLLAAVGVTAAGFLVPLYSNYAHMEGTGRQMAIAAFALVPALLLSSRTGGGLAVAIMMLLSLFLLAVLNPINIVVPLIVLAGYGLHQVMVQHRPGWWLVAPSALVPLLMLDPYYFGLIAGSGMPESRFSVDAGLTFKPVKMILEQWLAALGRGPGEFLAGNTRFLPAQSPVFIVCASTLLVVLWWFRRWSTTQVLRATVAGLFILGSLWVTDAFFDTLVDDRRFYLLAPYYWLSLAQFKILLITSMVLAVVYAIHLKKLPVIAMVAFAIVAIMAIGTAIHHAQPVMKQPRFEYCGSLGCVDPDDLAVLHEFEAMAARGSLRPGRVLLPNSTHKAHREKWVFPVTGARALPFFDVPAAAFYYYQGDPEFTTTNYLIRVCEQFDRHWLLLQNIRYVFLPTNRSSACVYGIDSLVSTEAVLVRSGNSMILELR